MVDIISTPPIYLLVNREEFHIIFNLSVLNMKQAFWHNNLSILYETGYHIELIKFSLFYFGSVFSVLAQQ